MASEMLRIIKTPMGQELIAELNLFEVDFTSAGNMRVDVRSKDHHGDLVIATALALSAAFSWSSPASSSCCSVNDLPPATLSGPQARR